MGEKIKVVIGGINGRFGRASAKAIMADEGLELVGAFGREGADYVGQDVGSLAGTLKTDILVSNGFPEVADRVRPDVYLDFSTAESAVEQGKYALEHGINPVIGTSGLNDRDVAELSALSAKTGVGGMVVPNFSVGAVLMMEFARMAGRFFPNVEIVEMHHTRKLDAPSGTAMHTAKKLAATGARFNAREVDEKELLPGSRGGVGEAGVRVHSLRLPGLISHQEVILGSDGELLTIRHDGLTANCYLKGILMAVKATAGTTRFVVGLESLLGLTA
jgi:4-hydroxy-tetrahydrodipicolinate reductase